MSNHMYIFCHASCRSLQYSCSIIYKGVELKAKKNRVFSMIFVRLSIVKVQLRWFQIFNMNGQLLSTNRKKKIYFLKIGILKM